MVKNFFHCLIFSGILALMLPALPLPAAIPVYEQQVEGREISGTVTDEKAEPVIGARVQLQQNPAVGAITDVNGHFSLKPVKEGDQLMVSYMGYQKAVITVGKASVYEVQLKPDNLMLEELVVVGYGVQKKESLTGSLQVIDAKELKGVTAPNLTEMLSGKAPGVMVASGSGRPGATGAIIIRGKSTINGSTAPLWVIDGVIVGNSPGSLNPSDVASLTVLKDAASTAIYGSQGANGVIVVTTHSAKTGKIRVEVEAKMAATQLNNGNLEVMSGAELYDYYMGFPNKEQIVFPRWNEKLRDSNFNWWDAATRTGLAQDYNVQLSGGSESLRTMFSLGMYNETGAVKGYRFTRYSFRSKTEFRPSNWLSIKPELSGSRKVVDDRQHSLTAMYANLPWDSPYDEEGNIIPNRSPKWVNSNSSNYLYDLQWNKGAAASTHFIGGINLELRLRKDLRFSSVNNYKWDSSQSQGYADPRSQSAEGVRGRLSEYREEVAQRYTNQLLRYSPQIGKHSIEALLGYEYRDSHFRSLSASGTGFIPGFEVLDVVSKPEKVGGTIYEWAVQSFFTNANYNYDHRYFLQLSARRDGASNFGSKAKYGNFYSISGAWNMASESWFRNQYVDLLKLRLSYGTVGNRPRSLYPQYDLYSVSGSYNEIPAALISQIGNKSLTWEGTKTLGLGLEASVLERFRLTLDLYSKRTDNLLYPVPVTGLVGVTSIWRNVGEIDNHGLELTLGADIIKQKDWLWTLNLNLSANKNKVVSLYGDEPRIIISDGIGIAGSAQKVLKPGLDSDTFYLREWAGVNPENGAPQWYKTTEKGERVKTEKYAEADEVILSSSAPKFFGGFSTYLAYKNLSLDANFGYTYGGKIYNYFRTEYDSDGAYTDRNQMKLQKGWSRWEKKGDIATHPLAKYENKSGSNKASSRFLEDGSFLKLRSLTLAYKKDFKEGSFIRSARVSLTGENLFCWTKYSGVDPEVPVINGNVIGSAGPSVYPSTRKYVLGLSLSF